MPRGLARGRSRRGRGSCSTPQCSEHPLVEVPWPGRPSIAGRNISAGPPTSGAAVFLPSARTCRPQPICVLPRVPDYSEDNTGFPKVLLTSSCGQGKILSPTHDDRKYAEGFPRDRLKARGPLCRLPRTKVCSSQTWTASCTLLLCVLMLGITSNRI
jgi:hypothetical protein